MKTRLNIFIIIHMFEVHRRNERCSWYKFIFGLGFFSSWETRVVLLRESWFFYTIQEVKALNCFLLCQLKITDLFNLIASTPARIWGGVGGGMSNLNLLISRSKFTKKKLDIGTPPPNLKKNSGSAHATCTFFLFFF